MIIQPPRGALRALGLLLADGAPTEGGGRLLARRLIFFYENDRNSETKSRIIVPKVGNEPSP